jgi:hypothetical protein
MIENLKAHYVNAIFGKQRNYLLLGTQRYEKWMEAKTLIIYV